MSAHEIGDMHHLIDAALGSLDGGAADDQGIADSAFGHASLYWLKGVIETTCAHIGP